MTREELMTLYHKMLKSSSVEDHYFGSEYAKILDLLGKFNKVEIFESIKISKIAEEQYNNNVRLYEITHKSEYFYRSCADKKCIVSYAKDDEIITFLNGLDLKAFTFNELIERVKNSKLKDRVVLDKIRYLYDLYMLGV